jgi:hypothetical protein
MSEDMRKKFEDHLLNIAPFNLSKRQDGEYENDILETRWQDWKACAESKQAEIEERNKRIEYLKFELGEAAENISDWGAYASEYFQEKWNLAGDIEQARKAIESVDSTWFNQQVAERQSVIDMLMLEYCPDEMTNEQLANWVRCQVAAAE